MIRAFRSLAWLRWHLMVNQLKGGQRRDAGERLARILQLVLVGLFLVSLIPTAAGMAFLGFFGGRALAASDAGMILVVVRILLAAWMLMTLLWPFVRSVQGSIPNVTRLLLLPIPHRALHVGEILSGLTDPWTIVLVPGLVMLPLGMLTRGAAVTSLQGVVAGALLVGLILLLGSGVSLLLQLVLRDRRRSELLGVVLVLFLTLGSFFIAFPEAIWGEGGDRDGTPFVPRFQVPGWFVIFPTELYARAITVGADGLPVAPLLPLAGLFLQNAVAFELTRRMHRRIVETPAITSRGRGGEARPIRLVRIPGLGQAASAVAFVQVRTFLRTLTGKMAFFFSPVVILLLSVMLFRSTDLLEAISLPLGADALITVMATVLVILWVYPLVLNLYATDGAGLTLQFLAPVSDRQLVVGKMAACAFLVGAPLGFCALAALVIAPGGPYLVWLSALGAGVSMCLLSVPVAALLSAVFPRAADLNKMGSKSNPHTAAALIGFLMIALALGLPVLLTLAAMFLLENIVLGLALVLGWTVFCAGVGALLVRIAARVLRARRENVLMVAQGR